MRVEPACLVGENLREPLDAELRDGIRAPERLAPASDATRREQHRRIGGLPQEWHEYLGQDERCREIDVQDLMPGADVVLLEGVRSPSTAALWSRPSSLPYFSRSPLTRSKYAGPCAFARSMTAMVGCCPPAAAISSCTPSSLRLGAPQQNDSGAMCGECERGRTPDPIAGTGHEYDAVAQQIWPGAIVSVIDAGHLPRDWRASVRAREIVTRRRPAGSLEAGVAGSGQRRVAGRRLDFARETRVPAGRGCRARSAGARRAGPCARGSRRPR